MSAFVEASYCGENSSASTARDPSRERLPEIDTRLIEGVDHSQTDGPSTGTIAPAGSTSSTDGLSTRNREPSATISALVPTCRLRFGGAGERRFEPRFEGYASAIVAAAGQV